MDLSSMRDAIERYARAVQEADVDELRSTTFGVLREQLSLEKTQLMVAQLAADTCQRGSISVSDFRDAFIDAEQCKITATVNFEQAPPLDVRFRLIELRGRWLLVGADTLPGDAGGQWRHRARESAKPIQRRRVLRPAACIAAERYEHADVVALNEAYRCDGAQVSFVVQRLGCRADQFSTRSGRNGACVRDREPD